jgi:hypothetical protein
MTAVIGIYSYAEENNVSPTVKLKNNLTYKIVSDMSENKESKDELFKRFNNSKDAKLGLLYNKMPGKCGYWYCSNCNKMSDRELCQSCKHWFCSSKSCLEPRSGDLWECPKCNYNKPY